MRPVCDVCAALFITCHYDRRKPDWLDGGARQDEMADRLRREVKEKAAQRRAALASHRSGESVSPAETGEQASVAGEPANLVPARHQDDVEALGGAASVDDGGSLAFGVPCPQPEVSTLRPQRGHDCSHLGSGKNTRDSVAFERSDTVLLIFYLDHLFPFLFPFYRPSLLEGGRAWILEMLISSPVVRRATLCQSSYFFSLARGSGDGDLIWDTMLAQTGDAFGVLRQSLQVIEDSGAVGHVHGAVRIISSILQVQRFEVAVLRFNNCRAHLNAARVLFKQLLDGPVETRPAESGTSFNAVLDRLGPQSWIEPTQVPISSAEQAAFRFSSALLILDDIIAGTVLQEEPTLYEYHQGLLGDNHGAGAPINLEAVVGCQNWVLLQIGEIAVLDAWKQQCKSAGNLNVMDLVRRATAIKASLESHLERLKTQQDQVPFPAGAGTGNLLDVFAAARGGQYTSTPGQTTSLVTRVWAHAALAYLFVVVSGWQPASGDVRHHVGQVLQLLASDVSPPALLRTMVWPFCVAGCLAAPAQEAQLRGMVEALQPPSVFGTVRRAFGIMEDVWRSRDAADEANRDLAACFRSQGDLVLLV